MRHLARDPDRCARRLRPSKLLLIFDLDGTLIDSREDLAIATNATRAHFHLPPLSQEIIQSYVGDGAAMLVRRAFGPAATDEVIGNAVAFFLDFYRTHSLQHTRLYNGVATAISELVNDDHSLAVLTNKPRQISLDILRALGLGKSFFQTYGGDSLSSKKPDPIGIHTLQGQTSIPASATWMIGDSGVDVQTARNAGAKACGVSWGFQPQAFEAFPPDRLVHSPSEWPSLFRP